MRVSVDDLEAGLAFDRDRLAHELIWRSETAAGLRMPETDTELVIQTEREGVEVDLLVDAADDAALRFVDAGGAVAAAPFDIAIGRCVVVRDPWGNELVMLDASKGSLRIDADGNVIS